MIIYNRDAQAIYPNIRLIDTGCKVCGVLIEQEHPRTLEKTKGMCWDCFHETLPSGKADSPHLLEKAVKSLERQMYHAQNIVTPLTIEDMVWYLQMAEISPEVLDYLIPQRIRTFKWLEAGYFLSVKGLPLGHSNVIIHTPKK